MDKFIIRTINFISAITVLSFITYGSCILYTDKVSRVASSENRDILEIHISELPNYDYSEGDAVLAKVMYPTYESNKENEKVDETEQKSIIPRVKLEKELPCTTPLMALAINVESTTVPTRDINYGVDNSKPIKVWSHHGGELVDYANLEETTVAVLRRMPNIRTTDELVSLVMETMIVETRLGAHSYTYAAKNYRNYGIAQLREDTAIDTLKWLKMIRPDVHKAVYSLYDEKLSMRDNLMSNVPFSIAMCVQYYWRRDVNLQLSSSTLESRAQLWKQQYNTPAGAGTVDKYIQRVYAFNK